jgi:hypothetical protein
MMARACRVSRERFASSNQQRCVLRRSLPIYLRHTVN